MSEEPQQDGESNQLDPDKVRETNSTLEKLLREVLHSEEFQKHLASVSHYKRPANTSKAGNYSYYKPVYALQVKSVIDLMLQDKKDREWKFADFPNMRPKTLKLRVWQGIRYLIDCLDTPDKTYAKFWEVTVIETTRTGIRLGFVQDLLEDRGFKPQVVTMEYKMQQWKVELDKFLNDRKKRVLKLKQLSLTNEEIAYLNESIGGVTGLYVFIPENGSEIIVRKDNDLVDEDAT